MNGFRRFLLVIYSVALIAAAAGIGALAWNDDEQLDLDIGELNMQAFIDASDDAKWALTAVLAGVALLGVITLLIAVWPHREKASSKSTLRMKQADGGTVEVTAGAIESLLKDELELLPEVSTVTPHVKLVGGAVETYLEAEIHPSTSIAHATRVLGSGVENVLKENIGVTSVRKPVIRITYDDLAVRPIATSRMRPQAEVVRQDMEPEPDYVSTDRERDDANAAGVDTRRDD